jgi:hypothetical protein
VYSSAIFREKSEWLQLTGRVLMTWSIFNPYGPTVNCLGFADTTEDGVKEIFWRWLHWHEDRAFSLGRIDVRHDAWRDELQLKLMSRFGADALWPPGIPMLTAVPSIVTVTDWVEITDLSRFLFRLAPILRGGALAPHLYRHLKYGARLFHRTTEELHGAGESTKRHGPTKEPVVPDVSPDQMIDFWYEAVTDPEFVARANVELAIAWVGGTHTGTKTDADPAIRVQYEDLAAFLRHFGHPDLIAAESNADIAARFGVDRTWFRKGEAP